MCFKHNREKYDLDIGLLTKLKFSKINGRSVENEIEMDFLLNCELNLIKTNFVTCFDVKWFLCSQLLTICKP